jgi:hypothetical protein
MPVTVFCPACGAKGKVPDAYVGKAILCPKCGGKFHVTIPGVELVDEPPEVLPADPTPPPARKKRSRWCDEWFEVRVSARILKWPEKCACCCGWPDDVFRAESTRTTGVRVVREDSRSWPVPYCSRCLEHMEVTAEADAINLQVHDYTYVAVSILVACVAVACVLWPMVFLVIPAGIWLYFARQMDADNAREARKKKGKMIAEARSLMEATCCNLREAAAYDGWEGSIHTFRFRNRRFLDAFCDLNESKVI